MSTEEIAVNTSDKMMHDEIACDFIGKALKDGDFAERLMGRSKLVQKMLDTVRTLRGHSSVSQPEAARYAVLAGKLRAAVDVGGAANIIVIGGPLEARYSLEEDTIKKQIVRHQDELNEMSPVATILSDGYAGITNQSQRTERALDELKKTGYAVEREGFGRIVFERNQINKSMDYLHTPAERAAIAAVPAVLKRGIVISEASEHKARGFNTVTFGAPVSINGQVGNMGVVVKMLGRNLYKTHRIISSDGSMFVLPETEDAESGSDGRFFGKPETQIQPTDSASENNVAQSGENGKGKNEKTRYSLDENGNWNDDEDLSYRFTRKPRPIGAYGYAEFADNTDLNYGYGKYAYNVPREKLSTISELYNEMKKALDNSVADGSIYDYEPNFDEIGEDEFLKEFDPEDIVISAGAWDNPDWVQWFFDKVAEPGDIAGVKTQEGAIVFDENIIRPDYDAASYFHDNNVRYSLDEDYMSGLVQDAEERDKVVQPWEETERQAAKAGYPVLNGKQVFPFKTWVKDAGRGNYGLVIGKGFDREDGELLKVSFWNKDQNARAVAELPVSELEAVSGKYQPEDAELRSLFESEPADNLRGAVSPEITAASDQLQRMANVSSQIVKVKRGLDSWYGEQADTYREGARQEFDAAMADYLPELSQIRKYYEQRAREKSAKKDALKFAGMELDDQSVQYVRQLWKDQKEAKRKLDRAKARNLMTDADNEFVDRAIRGETSIDNIPEDLNARGIRAVYEARSNFEDYDQQIQAFNRQRKAALRAEADTYLADVLKWKDKPSGFQYMRETMERNMRDIAPKEDAEGMIARYFEPVHQNEAEATRLKNGYRNRIRELDISRKVQKGNSDSEAAAVQFLGEAEDNIRTLEAQAKKGRQEDWRNGHTLQEWRDLVIDFKTKNPNMDFGKVEWDVSEFRSIYNDLFEKMNDARIKNGYEPVDYRKGYFPHFQDGHTDEVFAKIGKALGMEMDATALPTSINGITHTFKPGIQWQAAAHAREGFTTDYDAVEGFDKYLESAAGVICHTNDLQSLRALAEQIRYRSSDKGIQEQIDALREDPSLTMEEREDKIRDVYDKRLHRTCCSDRRAISLAFLLAKTLTRPFSGCKTSSKIVKNFDSEKACRALKTLGKLKKSRSLNDYGIFSFWQRTRV